MYKMKEIFAIVALMSVASADVFDILMEGVEKSGKECIPKVGATKDDLAEIINHKVPTSDAGKCLIACIQKDLGMQLPNGRLHKEGILHRLLPLKNTDEEAYEKLKEIFEKCVDEVENDDSECITGSNYKQCILDNLN